MYIGYLQLIFLFQLLSENLNKLILTGRLCIICGRKSCCHLVGHRPPGVYNLQKDRADQASIGPTPNIKNKLATEEYDGHPKVSILE